MYKIIVKMYDILHFKTYLNIFNLFKNEKYDDLSFHISSLTSYLYRSCNIKSYSIR